VIGVNLFGDLTGEGSLSETARTTANALARRGVAFTYNELLFPYAMYRDAVGAIPVDYPTGMRYPANLFCYNLHLFGTLDPAWLADVRANRYTMGLWVWEMPAVPEIWHGEFSKLDEVWCPSNFVRASFQKVTQNPVIVVPHPIELLPQSVGRAAFGLDKERAVFLFTFSAGSGDGRKNPWGVIDAYRRAFGNSSAPDKPLLLIKTQHATHYPDLIAALQRELDAVGGRLITETYSRQQMHDLYYNIDAYVSLHRAEGFGLGLAETMAAGKPVIAAAYSGPLDFMTPENSYSVDYTLRPVTAEDHRYRQELVDYYRPGMVWAEANVDQAAAHMVSVYEHPDDARAKGERAAQHMRTRFSPEAVGAIMEARIRATPPPPEVPPAS
jgi:glycosyltransferase involved in cell wall biosynthesis